MTVFYIIKNTPDVSGELLSASISSRKSLDETKTVLKFEADTTDTLFASETIIERSGVLSEMTEGEWA